MGQHTYLCLDHGPNTSNGPILVHVGAELTAHSRDPMQNTQLRRWTKRSRVRATGGTWKCFCEAGPGATRSACSPGSLEVLLMMRLCEPLNGIIYIYCTECRAAPLQTCRRANCWLTAPHCTALHCKSLVIIGIDCPRQDHFFADEVESVL
jgi:hypothetical protein